MLYANCWARRMRMNAYTSIPAWPLIRQRHLAFWERRVPDGGVLMHVQNPRREPRVPMPAFYRAPHAKNVLDPGQQFAIKEYRRGLWEYHGDLYEWEIPSFRPGNLAAYLTHEVRFSGDTSWPVPVGERIEDVLDLEFDLANEFWQATLELTDSLVERYRAMIQIGMAAFAGPADWLAALIGAENLCAEAASKPDTVRQTSERLADLCVRLDDILYAKVFPHFDGCCNWLPMWDAGRVKLVQDDTMILFSPTMYGDVFGSSISRLLAGGDHTMFHFHDGAVQHLDWLLNMPDLHAVQFGHDPTTPPLTQQTAALRRIQLAGKGLFISVVRPDEVRPLIHGLDPRGLLLLPHCSDRDASRRIVESARKWTAERCEALGLALG